LTPSDHHLTAYTHLHLPERANNYITIKYLHPSKITPILPMYSRTTHHHTHRAYRPRTSAKSRPSLITRLITRIRTLLRDLYHHLQERPFQVLLPVLASLLVSGGLLAAILKRTGVVVPVWLGRLARGMGGMGGIGGMMGVARAMGVDFDGRGERGYRKKRSRSGDDAFGFGGRNWGGGGMWNGVMNVVEDFL